MFCLNRKSVQAVFNPPPPPIPVAVHNELPEAPAIPTGVYLNGPAPDHADVSRKRIDTFEIKQMLSEQHGIESIRYIACGYFGNVYSAKDAANNHFALKTLMTDHHEVAKIDLWADQNRAELYYNTKLQHANLVKFHEEIWISVPVKHYDLMVVPQKPNCLIMKTELLQTSVVAILSKGPMAESVVARMGKQLASALAYMHSLGVAHNDIKPDNIMIAEAVNTHTSKKHLKAQLLHCTFKLYDMGLCRKYPLADGLYLEESSYCEGTSLFLSPEKFDCACTKAKGSPYNPYLADTYALGVTMFWAMKGTPKMMNKMAGIDMNLQPAKAYARMADITFEYVEKWFPKLTDRKSVVPPVHRATVQMFAPESHRFQAGEVFNVLDA